MRAAALLALALAGCASDPGTRFEFAEPHLGTTVRIVLHAPDEAAAARAARAGFEAIAAVNASMSDWFEESELMRLVRAGEGVASAPLFEVLAAAVRFAELSDGAFDPTVGPLVRLWRKGEVPSREAIAAARAVVGWRRVHLDPSTRRVRLEPGTRVDLGAIAKGWACDRALEALGLERALVDAGGDLALGAPPPGEPGWRVAMPDGRVLVVSRCGVATSGDTERAVEAGGRRFSHILDPRTGLGIEGVRGVTVVAPDATTADAMATAISVGGLALAARVDDVEAVVRRADGSAEATPGFARHLGPAAPGPPSASTSRSRPPPADAATREAGILVASRHPRPLMQTVKIVVWEEDGKWLGYLLEYPDYWTQGDSLEDLRDHLKDLHSDLASGTIPGIRRVEDLIVS